MTCRFTTGILYGIILFRWPSSLIFHTIIVCIYMTFTLDSIASWKYQKFICISVIHRLHYNEFECIIMLCILVQCSTHTQTHMPSTFIIHQKAHRILISSVCIIYTRCFVAAYSTKLIIIPIHTTESIPNKI